MIATTTDLRLNLNRSSKNHQEPSKNLSRIKNHLYLVLYKWLILWLLRQGSNLNSSDPESDVLPITLRSTIKRVQIYIFFRRHFPLNKKCAPNRPGAPSR